LSFTQRLKGIPLHRRLVQTGITVHPVIVVAHLKAQSLELDNGRHIPERVGPLNLTRSRERLSNPGVLGWRASAVLRIAGLVGAGIIIVGHPIAVFIRGPFRTAQILGRTGVVGAHIPIVGHTVAIAIGAALELGRSGRAGTCILAVGDTVTIRVLVTAAGTSGAGVIPRIFDRAASVFGRARIVRALVFAVTHTVAVPIGAAPGGGHARLVGALILIIGEPVPIPVTIRGCRTAALGRSGIVGALVLPVGRRITIPVGTTVGRFGSGLVGAGILFIWDAVSIPISYQGTTGPRPRFIGAFVVFIGNAVPIPVAIGDHRAAAVLRHTCLIGAGVRTVGNAITIPVGAAIGRRHTRLIGASVHSIVYAVPIPVTCRGGLDLDRGLTLLALHIERPGDQRVLSGGQGLP
jgi:hypothetical protein